MIIRKVIFQLAVAVIGCAVNSEAVMGAGLRLTEHEHEKWGISSRRNRRPVNYENTE